MALTKSKEHPFYQSDVLLVKRTTVRLSINPKQTSYQYEVHIVIYRLPNNSLSWSYHYRTVRSTCNIDRAKELLGIVHGRADVVVGIVHGRDDVVAHEVGYGGSGSCSWPRLSSD